MSALNPARMRPGAMIRLYWLNDRHHRGDAGGDGFRDFLVLEVGRKWAHLLYVPTLSKVRVPVGELAKASPRGPRRWTPSKLVARIKTTRAARKRQKLEWSKPGTEKAIDLLVPKSRVPSS